jgi:hypothetical protein
MRHSRNPYGSDSRAGEGISRDGILLCVVDVSLLSTRMLGMEHKWVGFHVGCAGLRWQAPILRSMHGFLA